MKEPITQKESIMTAWQEGARKDIETAFGSLQSKFQWIARPINLHNLTDISNRVAMSYPPQHVVSDRVMDGDVNARYNPAQMVALKERIPQGFETTTGVSNMRSYASRLSIDKDIWNDLKDVQEHARLHVAISDLKLSERLK
jgi:hypothetical protein